MTQARPSYLGVGIYRLSEAARLTSVPTQKISRWVCGYTYRSAGKAHRAMPIWERQLPDVDGVVAVGFLDLMEIRFVEAFRRYGVSLQTVRRAARCARKLIGHEHAFSTKRFRTDGRTIFAELHPRDKAEERVLLDLKKSQFAFDKILKPYLYAGLEFEGGVTARWYPLEGSQRIVVDPRRAFGQPIVAKEGVPTAILTAAVKHGQSPTAVAKWYEVEPESVRDAIAFERQLAA